MRAVMASVMAVGLVGCASQPGPDTAKRDDQQGGRVRVLNIPALGAGILHCDGGGAQPKHGYPSCDEIPVIVLDTGSGGCASLLPYNELWVNVGGNTPKTSVTWVILGPANYKFDPTQKGITFVNPDITWEDGIDVSTPHKSMYRWSVRKNAKFGYVADHQAYIVSDKNVPCTPLDPKAVNTDQ